MVAEKKNRPAFEDEIGDLIETAVELGDLVKTGRDRSVVPVTWRRGLQAHPLRRSEDPRSSESCTLSPASIVW